MGRDTVEKAKAAGAHAGAEAGSQEAQILSALRGGVLEVKFHRNPSMEDGPPTAKCARPPVHSPHPPGEPTKHHPCNLDHSWQ